MRYTAKKIGTLLLTMVLVSLFVFLAFSLISGDAAERLLGTEATPERLAALRAEQTRKVIEKDEQLQKNIENILEA